MGIILANDTRQRILDAALDMFSKNGYSRTNIRELSESINIGKSSMYRHFESKEDLWDSVIEMGSTYYIDHIGSSNNLKYLPKNTDELYEMTMQMVNFTINDETIIKMRKIITIEQYCNTKAKKLAKYYFVDNIKEMFKVIFLSMIACGSIKKVDENFLAFSYTSPIVSLIHLCDREPERKQEIIINIQNLLEIL